MSLVCWSSHHSYCKMTCMLIISHYLRSCSDQCWLLCCIDLYSLALNTFWYIAVTCNKEQKCDNYNSVTYRKKSGHWVSSKAFFQIKGSQTLYKERSGDFPVAASFGYRPIVVRVSFYHANSSSRKIMCAFTGISTWEGLGTSQSLTCSAAV